MLIRLAKLFGAVICVIACLQLAVAQCRKPKDWETPHGANEFHLEDAGAIKRVQGMVSFPKTDMIIEIYIYSGSQSYEDVNRVLGEKRSAACVTSDGGRFSFPNLKPGRYLLRAGTRERDQFNESHIILNLDPKRGNNKKLVIALTLGT